MLEVRLLGTFDVKCDGKPVIISSRAAQSFLAYLAMHPTISHRREKIAGMFWPEATEEKARAYLRHELWRIRKALSSKSKAEYLIADDINIAFNTSVEYWLDVAMLIELSDSASSEELIKGLSIIHGELLPGFYEDWITQEREHLQAVYEQKMSRLLESLAEEKRWHETLEWAERWIIVGSGPEAAYRYLMIAYDALGDHMRVTSTYERCRKALGALDLEPSEQTRALAFKWAAKLKVPIPLTSFIGREKELEEVGELFTKSRLLTLTGSGGVGKTRLAIQVITDLLETFPDGIWFLDLSPIIDPSFVPRTLANLLDLRESGEPSTTSLLVNFFQSRTALVIFDNCEHVIEACAQLIHTLLTSCANLSVLATSRETLRVSGEIPYRVPSLEVPKSDIESSVEALKKIESVRLFLERAGFASLGFTISGENALSIAQICQRLDGIPLAIELAAARVNVLTVEQIINRLDDRFNLLTHGLRSSLPRQQTLRAMIEWSYDLLTEKERVLFRRLSIFVGGCSLEAAEQVCTISSIKSGEVLDLLTQLVNKSLLLVESSNRQSRYFRLETIQQLAREKLSESGEEEKVRSSHLSYFLQLAQTAEPELHGARQFEWSQRLVDEHENMRAALGWSLQNNLTACQELAGALWWSWNFNGYLSEGYEWLTKILDVTQGHETLIRANLLSGAGWLATMLGYDEQSIKTPSKASIALFNQLGEKESAAFPLSTLAVLSYGQLDYEQAILFAEESCALFRKAGNRWGIRHALSGLGYINAAQENFEQAQMYFEESLSICKEIGDVEGSGWILHNMGEAAAAQGNDIRAMELYEEALEIEKAVKNKPLTAWTLRNMGRVSIRLGNYEKGRLLFEEVMEINRKMGDQFGITVALQNLGLIARLQGDYPKARSLYFEGLKLSHQIQNNGSIGEGLIHIGLLLGTQGSPEKYVYLLGIIERTLPEIHKLMELMEPFVHNETAKFNQIAHAVLGDEAYNAAWEAGRQVGLHEAVTYALTELQ